MSASSGPLPLIIDCDPGIDDAVMLMIAFASPKLDLRAITTVAGNVPLRLTSRNARMICERMGRPDVPVHAGCPRPLMRKPVTAEDFHGESGIEGIEIFQPKAPLAPGHAVSELIARLSAAAPLSQTVILSGPMTNLAAALVMARESVARALNLPIVARVAAHAAHAHEPGLFTTAPVPAMQKALRKAGWSVTDIDLWEVNEAFAVVPMIAMHEMEIDHARLNVNGGACALGHPIGASGARVLATLLAALQARGGKKGVASLCIGGGEAIAMAVELEQARKT